MGYRMNLPPSLAQEADRMTGDEQVVTLKEWMQQRFGNLERRLDRAANREEKRLEAIQALAERISTVEHTVSTGGGVVTAEATRLRDHNVAARLVNHDERMDSLERIYAQLSKRLWGFMAAMLGLFAAGIALPFIFG